LYFEQTTFLLSHTLDSSCTTQLFSSDPLKTGISFVDGKKSKTYSSWYTQQLSEDITFGTNVTNSLTLAPQGSRLAAYVDLGTGETLRQKYMIDPDVPSGSIYISIHYDDNNNLVLADSKTNGTFQEFLASDISGLWSQTVMPSFLPFVGHIYLFNLTDKEDSSFNRVVKLVVTDISKSSSINFRWDVLRDMAQGENINCFVQANEPDNGNDGNNGFYRRTEQWVRDSFIALFVLTGILLVAVVLALSITIIRHRKRHGFEKI